MSLLTVTTAPAVTPITLAEAKSQLRLTTSNEDDHVTTLIEAATTRAEEYQRRSLVNRTYTLLVKDFSGWKILLSRPPLVSVTSVKYYDVDGAQQTLVAGTDYQVVQHDTTPYLLPAVDTEWPATDGRENGVEIVYVAGYGASGDDVPADTKQGIKMLVSDFFENRESEIVGLMTMSMKMTAKSLLSIDRIREV